MTAPPISQPVQTDTPTGGSPRSVSRTRWAAIGAAIAVTIGGGGIGLTHAISTDGGNNVFVPIAPCRLLDTRPATAVGPRTSPLGPSETFTQQVTGDNGQCLGVPAGVAAVSMNVTAVNGTAGSFLTLFPADLATAPLASNLNWVPGSPPTPNKVDVKLSPSGAVKLFNLAGTVDVVADVVGYYTSADARYPRKVQVTYNLAAGALSAPIAIPAMDVPVSLTGTQLAVNFRGVASSVLLVPSVAPQFVEWTGLDSTNAGAISQGFSATPGVKILFIDFAHQVIVEVNDATSIRVHNTNTVPMNGVITLTW